MDQSSSIAEIVEGELEIIKSAFSNEFEDLRENDPWKVKRPPEVRLKLGPHHTQGGTLHDHVSAVITICTSQEYPNEAANVEITKYDGLSSKEVSELAHQLKSLCVKASESGNVVMLEICHHTQNYLSEHARPFSESIYAEMVADREAKHEAEKREEEQIILQKAREDETNIDRLKVEQTRVFEALKAEAKQRRDKFKQRESESSGIGLDSDSNSQKKRTKSLNLTEDSRETAPDLPALTGLVSFSFGGKQERHIILSRTLGTRGNQYRHVTLGYEGPELSEKYVLHTWMVRVKKVGRRGHLTRTGQESRMEALVAKLTSIEKEVAAIVKFSHENLVKVLGISIDRPQPDKVNVHLLQDYVQGTTLNYFMDVQVPLSEPILHFVCSGILSALDYLHQNNIVHRNLRESCFFLNHAKRIIQLSDYGVEQRFVEAVMEFHEEDVPNLYPLSPGRGGKKGDVFRFGIVVLSLYLGRRVDQVLPTLPSSMSANFSNFVHRCIELNERDRWSCHKLLAHPFITKDCSIMRNSISNDESYFKEEESDDSQTSPPASMDVPLHLPPNLKGYSRFTSEYDIIEWLGKGGFGHVFKVRNRVDDRLYGLKRISLHHQSEAARKKMTREVKLLSSLNHENVVRYYTSWIESFAQNLNGESSDKKNTSVSRKDSTSDSSENSLEDEDDTGMVDSDKQDWLMQSLRFLQDDDDESDGIVFENSSSSMQGQDEVDNASDSSAKVLAPRVVAKKFQFLYLQMQLCEKSTLRQTIDKGLYLDEERMWRLFREMINGMDYIHSQSLIHRDLKPGNIFLDSTDHIKIGDFGLATVAFKEKTEIERTNKDCVDGSIDASTHTGQVGTTFYIAPEIFKGVSKVSYTNKVDIYSLGIIFFEMISTPSETGMERVKILTNLRQPDPIFPESFNSEPLISKKELVKWLLDVDPNQRPSTTDLLKSPHLPPPTAEEQKFVAMLETKIQNVRSTDYQDILNLIFKPNASPELEATFELGQTKLGMKQLWNFDHAKILITQVFKAHGGIYVPCPFYVPKGTFYFDKENLVNLMSRGGELIAAQYDLRYPFARFAARSDLKNIRRYSIDRVQRAHRIAGIHPKEIYECAFDIIGPKYNSLEHCGEVLLVALEILYQLSGKSDAQFIIRFGHSELVKLILKSCGLTKEVIPETMTLLKVFAISQPSLENAVDQLDFIGVPKSCIDMMKDFLLMEGQVEEICNIMNSKRNVQQSLFQGVISEIRKFQETLLIVGVKCELLLRPLLVCDASLYHGFSFQLIPQSTNKHKASIVIAQGGSFEHLIIQHRTKVCKKSDAVNPLSAVGISLPLDRIVASMDLNKNIQRVSDKFKYSSSGLAINVDVFICSYEKRQLEKRVELVGNLRREGISANHGHAATLSEAEAVCEEMHSTSHFVFIGSTADKVIWKNIDRQDNSALPVTERHISMSDIVKHLVSMFSVDMQSMPSTSSLIKKDYVKQSTFSLEGYIINFDYIIKKQSKLKDFVKVEMQVREEVISNLISRWTNIFPGSIVDAIITDIFERKSLLSLGTLDTDSTAKSFQDSMLDIKGRFPELKEGIDRMCKLLSKKIFYLKKSERPSVIVIYSVPADIFKRIL